MIYKVSIAYMIEAADSDEAKQLAADTLNAEIQNAGDGKISRHFFATTELPAKVLSKDGVKDLCAIERMTITGLVCEDPNSWISARPLRSVITTTDQTTDPTL